MIDLHIHLLPGIGDEPEDFGASLRMCQLAYADGIHTLVATPHLNPGLYNAPKKIILAKLAELKQNLKNKFSAAEPSKKIDLKILAGADMHLSFFLRQNLAHLFVSDAHSSANRPPILSRAVSKVSTIIGPEKARRMVHDLPLAIIAGDPIEIPDPEI